MVFKIYYLNLPDFCMKGVFIYAKNDFEIMKVVFAFILLPIMVYVNMEPVSDTYYYHYLRKEGFRISDMLPFTPCLHLMLI